MLASLTPREERVLRMRFGIGMNTDHTLEEVGQQFSVTRERIRQIEAKALRKLKHPSRSRKLRSFGFRDRLFDWETLRAHFPDLQKTQRKEPERAEGTLRISSEAQANKLLDFVSGLPIAAMRQPIQSR